MERIHVSVRARPLSSEDAKTSPWRISGNSISIANQQSKFEFDQIFGEDRRTKDVYGARTRDIVAAAVRGFNGTVFAYGQTSSGKTHTMRGSNSEPGVIPLAVHDLFHTIQQEMDREFLLRMSYMEIYNEEINDLLAPEHRKLQIHESIERGIFVAGLSENIVASADQVLEYMDFGESHRHIGETNMNVYSSRSHTIFRMIIESREKTDDAEGSMSCDAVRVSVLNLVDLAGSERASKTGAEGVRLKEGSHINKSLMTLGTVIKKLSEGVESQGGHVPYRDSKLTRILQPALGGNANTAIICNITLAQIHADETKSSLQFASRALRVTNCAHVNEILTDAALLKRQKKEIEELRAKLQGSHSDHLEDEILNLRNTLLKCELERETMALELEEEKRAQAEREKRLLEQAKRIENLSSMVFCANREEICDVSKKVKRRDTWCPGNLARKKLKELSSEVKDESPDVNSTRTDRAVGPLLPFEELVNDASKQDNDYQKSEMEDCTLPDPRALLNVTRRKIPHRKRSLPMENNYLAEMEEEYEKLLLKYETQRTISDNQIDHLMRKLSEAELVVNEKCIDCISTNVTAVSYQDGSSSLRESDAILVTKQLQEKIAILEMDKSSSQLDCIFDLETEQALSAQGKYEKLYKELVLAQEEAIRAHDALASAQSRMEEPGSLISLIKEAQEIKVEFENSKQLVGSISSVVDELLHFCADVSNPLFDLRPLASQISLQMKSIVRSHENVHSCLTNKVRELGDEKLVLYNHASELQNSIKELNLEAHKSADAFNELNKEHELEKSEFLGEIQMLKSEVSSLSSSSLVKEKENLRKDLDKTKSKLKDTEFKLKTAIQEKTKLEGEKSCLDREVKRLHGQQVMLERNINKRESVVGRRHESTTDRSSNVFDQKRTKGFNASAELAMQEDHKKLEVLAFEMEAVIASLENQLAIANEEKDIATSRAEALGSDLQALSDELDMSCSESSTLKEEVLDLRTSMEDSRLNGQKLESSLKTLSEEKEELSMQLTEALLTMEEEKAIWSSKEKASMELIEGAEKQRTAEVALLCKELSEARNELEICRKNCKDLEEWLSRSEESSNLQKQCKEKTSEINVSSVDELRASEDQSERSTDTLNAGQDSACQNVLEQIETLQLELSELRKERIYLLGQVEKLEAGCSVSSNDSQVMQLKLELEEQRAKLTNLEVRMLNDKANNSLEMAKVRMRLRGAQAKLDNYRVRYKELVDEMDFMNLKYKEASAKLKKQLAEYGTEVLILKRQLATSSRQ